MGVPPRMRVTLAIILGMSLGTGLLVFGTLMASGFSDDDAGLIAGGCGLLVGSAAALFVHLSGGFRDLDDREP